MDPVFTICNLVSPFLLLIYIMPRSSAIFCLGDSVRLLICLWWNVFEKNVNTIYPYSKLDSQYNVYYKKIDCSEVYNSEMPGGFRI